MNQDNMPDKKPEDSDRTNDNDPGREKFPEGHELPADDNIRPEEQSSEESAFNEGSAEQESEEQEEEIHFQKLYKSRKNKIIFGVCSGLGKYFNVDPVIFRLLFILSLLIGGWGLLIYFIASIILPYDPAEIRELGGVPEEEEIDHTRENTRMIIGSSLILLGLFALLRSTGLIRYFTFFGLTNEIVMPVILIAIGIFLIYRHNYRHSENRDDKDIPHYPERLRLSVQNKKIAGVCGGLGEYFGIDPNLIRVLWLIFTFSSFGVGILIYFLFAITVPKEKTV